MLWCILPMLMLNPQVGPGPEFLSFLLWDPQQPRQGLPAGQTGWLELLTINLVLIVFSPGFRRCNRRTRHPEWGQLQGQHPHHAGCNMFTLQKQVVWQLAFLEKVATALQIQHLILQNLTGLSFSCCETTWRCGPPTPPRKAKRPKRAPTTSLLFFSTISSRFQVWVLSFLKWSLLNFNLVATYSMCGILRLFMFAKALPSSTYRPSI